MIDNNPRDERLPPEVRQDTAQAAEVLLPENDESTVLVRIDLGIGAVATAVQDGRNATEIILDLFGRRGSAWREAGLTVHYCDGQYSGFARFVPDDDQELWTDPVSAALEANDGKIASILLDEPLRDCVRAARAASERNASPDDVVLSIVRGAEIVRRDTGVASNWTELLERFSSDHYVASGTLQELVDSLQMVSHMEQWQHWLRAPDGGDVAALFRELGRPAADLGRSCRLGIRIYTALDPNWLPARRLKQALRTVSYTTTTHAPRTAVNQLRLAFSRLLARTRRRRNAVAHGSRANSIDFGDVLPFCDRVDTILLARFLEDKALQKDPAGELQRRQNTAKERVDHLLAGNLQLVAEDWTSS